MDFDQIKELIAQIESSKLSKLVYKKGDFELQLEKESANIIVQRPRAVAADMDPAFHSENTPLKTERTGPTRAEQQVGAFVTSPMVGTFYATPAPDQPVFVKVGDHVSANTVVCIIEAMKVMNEVKAGISGVVAEVLVDNAQPVEFGTRLLRIV
jgi:acetyl-CoA carboxylase biotin carboxyl carrier protein